LGTAQQARVIGKLDRQRLDLRFTGLANGWRRHPKKSRTPLITNNQSALRVKTHADPRALAPRHAIEQLNAEILERLDLLDLRRLRGAAIVGGRLVVAPSALALLGGGKRGEKYTGNKRGDETAGHERERGAVNVAGKSTQY
jgi:hypothetical protein